MIVGPRDLLTYGPDDMLDHQMSKEPKDCRAEGTALITGNTQDLRKTIYIQIID